MISDTSVDIPLTRDARAVVDRAVEIAKRRGAAGAASNDVLQATAELQPQLVSSARVAGDGESSVPLQRVLINAGREAQSMGHRQVTPTHLLLALLYADSPATAIPLQEAGLSLYGVRQQAQSRPPGPALRPVATAISPVFLGILGVTAASGALLWISPVPALAVPLTLTFVLAGWIASLCIHEFGHALVAYIGGDRAVASAGYLSLNPLRYTNAAVSVVLPVFFLLLGGIALPGGLVYVNHSALRSRAWSSAVSLAGPLGTLACWLVIAAGFVVAQSAGLITSENIAFFGGLGVLGFFVAFGLVLTLLPVPGLDGFGIIRPWLPYSMQSASYRYGILPILGVYALLWFVTPVRNVFYELVFALTTLSGIPTDLIFYGLFHMRVF